MSPDMATVDAGTTPAQQLAHDLMLAAAWVADHADLLDDEHRGNASVNVGMVFHGEGDRLRRILAAFGDEAVVDAEAGTYVQARLDLGRVRLFTNFDRYHYCTPRVEGGVVVWDLDNLDEDAAVIR